MKKYLFLTIIGIVACLTSCDNDDLNNDDNEGKDKEPYSVIIDMDLGSSMDDIICLNLAYKYQQEGRLNVLGVIVDRMGQQNAEVADILNTYYGHGNTPIALERNGVENPMVFIDYAPVLISKKKEDGSPFFARTLTDYSTLPDGYKLYRKLLAEAPDNSVTIISCGFVTSLSHLLESGADEYSDLNGVELVKKKVRALYLQAGMFQEAQEPDYNFKQAPAFSLKFIALWPNTIPTYYNPMEVGQDIDYDPEKVLNDLADMKECPIYQIYSNCDCDTGQRMWDVMNIIWLMEGESFLNISEPGNVVWNPDFSTSFISNRNGSCRHLLPLSDDKAKLVLSHIRKKVMNQ